jgi:hypothetical protein
MGLVALHTGGNFVRFFLPESSLDYLDVHFFDPGVTLGTHVGNVSGVDRRFRMVVIENIMGRMAGRADCSDCKPSPKKSLSVNTLGVVLQNPILRYVMSQGNFGSFVMTSAA